MQSARYSFLFSIQVNTRIDQETVGATTTSSPLR